MLYMIAKESSPINGAILQYATNTSGVDVLEWGTYGNAEMLQREEAMMILWGLLIEDAGRDVGTTYHIVPQKS